MSDASSVEHFLYMHTEDSSGHTLKVGESWDCSCYNKGIRKRSRCFCDACIVGLTWSFPSLAPVVDQLVSFLVVRVTGKKYL